MAYVFFIVCRFFFVLISIATLTSGFPEGRAQEPISFMNGLLTNNFFNFTSIFDQLTDFVGRIIEGKHEDQKIQREEKDAVASTTSTKDLHPVTTPSALPALFVPLPNISRDGIPEKISDVLPKNISDRVPEQMKVADKLLNVGSFLQAAFKDLASTDRLIQELEYALALQ